MNTNRRIEHTLLAALLACGLVACTTQENNGGTGGTSGGGSGGSTPLGGAGGATPTAGTTGNGTLCPAPQQVITNFTYTATGTGGSTTEVRFGGAGTLQGGESYYPNSGTYPLTVDVTQSNFHITGTIGDYSGFGLYFDNCDHLDASAFKGISFTLSGSVPQGPITMGIGTINDTPTGTWMMTTGGKTTAKATDAGRCTPTSGTQYYHPGCTDPQTQVTVAASPTTVSLPWSSFTGGTPDNSPNPAEITTIYWFFPWSGSGATPYAVDLTMDDLQFTP